ncbi:MAG TPA: CDP-alcohol phosphatidyltransferase family protein [Candidatus Lumbricidophila sp.]|nr:CDP-alcohol phosphatidyltransferase family protein [Candidatus Lumbricidophila sp.]
MATPRVERPTETYRQTVARLASAQKRAARGAPPYSIYVNRPVGRLIAAAAYRAGMTPNGVTGVSALFTFSAIIMLAVVPPSLVLGVAVWLLLAIGYAFDSADGQVARLRGGGSPAGEWLDHVVDSAKLVSLHLAVLITAYLHFGLAIAWLLVPIAFTVVQVVAFFAMLLNDLLRAKHGAPTSLDADAAKRTPLRSLLGLPTDYGVLCIAFVLLGSIPAFTIGYSALFIANLGYLVLALLKWFGDMRRLGAAG